jgi:hypothetical protein
MPERPLAFQMHSRLKKKPHFAYPVLPRREYKRAPFEDIACLYKRHSVPSPIGLHGTLLLVFSKVLLIRPCIPISVYELGLPFRLSTFCLCWRLLRCIWKFSTVWLGPALYSLPGQSTHRMRGRYCALYPGGRVADPASESSLTLCPVF